MNDSLAFQEECREELIGGRLVLMSPAATNHNIIAGNIYYLFRHYLRGKKCWPLGDGELVCLTDEDHFVPDMMVVCDPEKVRGDGVHGAPDLVVEILSPSTEANDRGRKLDVYGSCGVREYWIVSPADKSVEVYRSKGKRFAAPDVHILPTEAQLARMSELERAGATHFKCGLFDDLDISLEDVFERLL